MGSALELLYTLHGKTADHVNIANCLTLLSRAEAGLGRFSEAKAYSTASVAMCTRLWGPHPHVSTVRAAVSLTHACGRLGLSEDAYDAVCVADSVFTRLDAHWTNTVDAVDVRFTLALQIVILRTRGVF